MHSLLLPILFLCSSLLVATNNTDHPIVTDCDTDYTGSGAFQANLDALLSSLPGAAAASSWFAENATGAVPDQAYGLAQCRADFNALGCGACLYGAARDMAIECPGKKGAMLIYDACLLRLSNASFFGDADMSPLLYLPNSQNVTEPAFSLQLGALMVNLTEKAAYGSPRMFAAGSAAVTPFVNVYGMAQCTRDLTGYDCNRCLAGAFSSIPTCCDGKQGRQLLYRSCSIRFEQYLFYNVQAAEAAMSPAPPPGGGGSVNGSDQAGPGSSGRVRTALLVSIPVAVALLVLLLLVGAYLCRRNRKPHKDAQIASTGGHGEEEDMRSSEFLLYDLSILRVATNNFSQENKLGEGGFGPVYKGTLQDGQKIAVKRLSATSQQGQVEMKNEVVLLAKLKHRNLVRLLGCCIEEHERLLVYEFLTNNSLDKILFGARRRELGWGQRHRIIEGIARGLQYLHEDSGLTIIHRDLKASNILLDADMNPKVSDFGLAKLFSIDSSVGNTSRIAGTYGYMAPEYALHGIFSAKSDVYSYGVLVLEIVTGRRNMFTQNAGPSEDLLTFVWRHWSRGNVGELLDGCPAEERRPQEMLRCIHVGLLCVQEDAHLRPGMASVVVMFNSRSITLPAPAAPAFAAVLGRSDITAVETRGTGHDDGPRVAAARPPSINGVSISDIEPR